MAAKQVALVIVSSEWFNTAGVRRFLGGQGRATVESDSHFIIAPLANADDPIGLWLNDVTTTAVQRVDGKPLTMKFMIPWAHIQGLGLVDESKKKPIGFKSDPNTIVLGQQSEG